MSSTITSVLAAVPFADAGPSLNPEAPPAIVPTSNVSTDTVELSEAQRVYRLYDQGQPVWEIAASLSLSVAEVNRYLGISVAA